jgi:hypothetical protein
METYWKVTTEKNIGELFSWFFKKKIVGCELDYTGSESYPLVEFGISSIYLVLED